MTSVRSMISCTVSGKNLTGDELLTKLKQMEEKYNQMLKLIPSDIFRHHENVLLPQTLSADQFRFQAFKFE